MVYLALLLHYRSTSRSIDAAEINERVYAPAHCIYLGLLSRVARKLSVTTQRIFSEAIFTPDAATCCLCNHKLFDWLAPSLFLPGTVVPLLGNSQPSKKCITNLLPLDC